MQVFETARLAVRPYKERDLPALYAILSDADTMAFWPAPFSYEQTADWLRRHIASSRADGLGRWAVVLKENGRLIGDIGIMRYEINGKMEYDLGYIVHSKYWKMGYGCEAAARCLAYAVDQLGLRRVCANMPVDHAASRRVAEKIGMTLETEFLNKRNRNLPTYLLSYTRQD